MYEAKNIVMSEGSKLVLGCVRLRSILETMKVPFYYDTDKKLLKNIEWYYRNLHIHNRRHENYIEAIDLIESIMNEA